MKGEVEMADIVFFYASLGRVSMQDEETWQVGGWTGQETGVRRGVLCMALYSTIKSI